MDIFIGGELYKVVGEGYLLASGGIVALVGILVKLAGRHEFQFAMVIEDGRFVTRLEIAKRASRSSIE
ncbi:MAG: hypothetical protein H8F28_16115 [Fibrella sp.]|nr:hypothetical protein [Armatimonadota bacterium]